MFHFKNPEMTDLFQWNTNVVLLFDAEYIGKTVHFSNDKVNSYSRVIDENGEVQIPDFLLKKALPLEIYLMIPYKNGEYTKKRRIVRVLARPKPDDYVDGDEEVKKWETKVDIYQGVENAGKFMMVDENGKLAAVSVTPGGSSSIVHSQASAEDTWQIQHNLGKYPSVSVVDSAGNLVVGEVRYDSLNSLTISFNGAFSGKAFLN